MRLTISIVFCVSLGVLARLRWSWPGQLCTARQMVKSMKMHKMQNALSARLMVNMVMAGQPAIPCTTRYAGSRQLWPSRQCGGATGGLWLKFGFFGNFICIRIRLTSCERDYNCQSDIWKLCSKCSLAKEQPSRRGNGRNNGQDDQELLLSD